MNKLIDLIKYNTLRIPAHAKYLLQWHSPKQLLDLRNAWQHYEEIVVLGGGSNLVITEDIDIPCVQSIDTSIRLVRKGIEYVDITVGAGFRWDALVWYCLNHGWYGLENLVSIPGTVGAAPVQNIGAYGREFADICQSVTIFDWSSAQQSQYLAGQCDFSYRNSRFKPENNRLNSRTIITSITLRLSSKANVHINASLINDLQQHLDYTVSDTISPLELAEKIRRLRQVKLPDPGTIANVGSFFHNPIITAEQYHNTPALQDKKKISRTRNGIKLSAAELLEANGWKGYKHISGAGVSEQHALSLVNEGGATGKDILKLAEQIQQDIYQSYGITLSIEPAIYRNNIE